MNNEIKQYACSNLLIQTCVEHDLDSAFILLNQGVNPNETLEDGTTPLMLAIESRYTEMVALLLRFGANVKQKDSLGETALNKAAKVGHSEIERWLAMYRK